MKGFCGGYRHWGPWRMGRLVHAAPSHDGGVCWLGADEQILGGLANGQRILEPVGSLASAGPGLPVAVGVLGSRNNRSGRCFLALLDERAFLGAVAHGTVEAIGRREVVMGDGCQKRTLLLLSVACQVPPPNQSRLNCGLTGNVSFSWTALSRPTPTGNCAHSASMCSP